MLHFISKFNYGLPNTSWFFMKLLANKIQLLRLSAIAGIRSIQKENEDDQVAIALNLATQDDNIYEGEEDASFLEPSNPFSLKLAKRSSTLHHMEDLQSGVQQFKMNPHNIFLEDGEKMTLSERFPGYFRLENGLLWCHNQEELAS